MLTDILLHCMISGRKPKGWLRATCNIWPPLRATCNIWPSLRLPETYGRRYWLPVTYGHRLVVARTSLGAGGCGYSSYRSLFPLPPLPTSCKYNNSHERVCAPYLNLFALYRGLFFEKESLWCFIAIKERWLLNIQLKD
jgi:hypothetical protein